MIVLERGFSGLSGLVLISCQRLDIPLLRSSSMHPISLLQKALIGFSLVLLMGCNREEIHGIKIGSTLNEQLSSIENQRLCYLIEHTLKQNESALIDLISFNCGGAAGCYDLGSVIAQIVHKTGEKDFVVVAKELTQPQKNELAGFIEVGLEYGYPLIPGKRNEKMHVQFPQLSKALGQE